MTERELCKYFDHTFLKAFATKADFEKLCNEAKELGTAMVAINSSPVTMCKELLKGTDVHVGAAIGFPLGQTTIATKVFETEDAIKNGADEIDYVINIGEAKMGHWDYIKDEIRKLAEISKEVKPDFIKTSTGFGTGGATLEDVKLMKSVVGDVVKVKAAGGIRDWETCKAMIEAGAERIGTSASIAIRDQFVACGGK